MSLTSLSISLNLNFLLIASKKKFFCFWKVNFQEEKIFLKFLFSPFKFPCYLSLQRTKRNERRTRNLFTPFLYFSRFFLFFLFSSSTIPSLCRLSTNVSRKRFTSYHGVTPRRRNTIIRVSPGILEGSFTPFAWVRVTSFTDQLLLSFSFFFFPRKNLVRKCPSVVVKSNPDLISCTSDTFAFLSHSRRE